MDNKKSKDQVKCCYKLIVDKKFLSAINKNFITLLLFLVPSKVMNLTAIPSNNTVMLSWKPPNKQNGVLSAYFIQYAVTKRSTSDKTEILITDLEAFSSYEFKVSFHIVISVSEKLLIVTKILYLLSSVIIRLL